MTKQVKSKQRVADYEIVTAECEVEKKQCGIKGLSENSN